MVGVEGPAENQPIYDMKVKLAKIISVKSFVIVLLVLLLYKYYLDNTRNYERLRSGAVVVEGVGNLGQPPLTRKERMKKKEHCNEMEKQTISYAELLGRQKRSPRTVCNCSRIQSNVFQQNSGVFVESTCSDEATLLGTNQKVISVSLYFHPTNNASKLLDQSYFRGVFANLKGMKKFYPGWVMRVYSDISLNEDMCHLICSDDNLFYCDVSQLPTIGDVRRIHPMIWRFLLIGDPTVEKFAVRDLDGRLSQRERDAVHQWEMTDFPFHGMRDHPWHRTAIMGGMWGANNYKLCLTVGTTIRKQLLSPKWMLAKYNDQQVIEQVIYFMFSSKILTHDSYLCTIYRDSVPFPSKRPNNYEYVGLPYLENFNISLEETCPVKCRPTYGMNWDYC